MRHVLLTGFEPFGGETENPSESVARALAGTLLAPGWRVQARVLPCVFGKSAKLLCETLDSLRPDIVLCLGQAGGRTSIGLERIAVNLDDARMPDNAGHCPVDQPVVPGGPAAYFCRLPVKAMRAAVQSAGWPVEISPSAGSYVCNHVFYALMHAVARRPQVQAGFVHLPWLPRQAAHQAQASPSLALPAQVAAVRILLATALAWRGRRDLGKAAGTLHGDVAP